MKKKKSKESLWFNKEVFYAMMFLTFASTITSCTVITSKPIKTVVKQPVVFDVPKIKEREFVFACDLVSELYICDRLTERK